MAARRAAASLPRAPLLFGRRPNHGPDLRAVMGLNKTGYIWGDRKTWETSALQLGDGCWHWRYWATWTDLPGFEVAYTSLSREFDPSRREFQTALRRNLRALHDCVNGARSARSPRRNG